MPEWPNLFVVGAPKAGTTSLHRYLDQHPDIAMVPDKEPWFFVRDWDRIEAERPGGLAAAEREYLDLFEGLDATYVGEATPSYLRHPEVPGRIHDRRPDARIVISLRDPVERAWSHYLMEHREGREDRSFAEAVGAELAAGGTDPLARIVEPGRYFGQVRRYLETFGEDQVHVLLLDDLGDDPHGTLEAVAAFLDVDPGPMQEVAVERHYGYRQPRSELARRIRNDERVRWVARRLLPERVREYLGDRVLMADRPKPDMDPEVRARLQEVYAPEVDRLEELLGRDLPELRRSWEAGRG